MERVGGFVESIGLITNVKRGNNFYSEMLEAFEGCKSFCFSVAFVNYSGLQLIINSLDALNRAGVKGKIITTNYLNFTDPNSLKKLTSFENFETKIYIVNNEGGFHTKGYIFEYEDHYKVFVGSSNLTQAALKTNIEWNIKIISKKDNVFIKSMLSEFDYLMGLSSAVNEDFIKRYETFYKEVLEYKHQEKIVFHDNEVVPNYLQTLAVESLRELRNSGESKALVISATATGKTYMSAFDVKDCNPETMLFIVHNEKILDDAIVTFGRVIKNKVIGKYTGNVKQEAEYLFASVATLSRDEHLNKFRPDQFKYIIIDEAHRAAAQSYRKVLQYFNPKFLLGMTATPERTDSGNVYELFDYNVATEIRLRDALAHDLVVPFHYFGITDTTADLSDINLNEIDVIAKRLKIHSRVDFIIEKMLHYGFQGVKRKCIAFCVNRSHADFMTEEFVKYGYKAKRLSGEDSIVKRTEAIEELENDDNPLEFIFTVDIFNEGVDIRSINLILMLRPTESPIIFTQQLGRGLRKCPGKDFLTVLDFIGNHNKSFLVSLALCGSKFYDQDSLKVSVEDNFSDLPGCTNIYLEEKSKEQILKQLDAVNFYSLRYLKEEYIEFKRQKNGRVPDLVDYLAENAPDPVKFIKAGKNYPGFLSSINERQYSKIVENPDKMRMLNWISSMLPIKRVHDFVILKELLLLGRVDSIEAEVKIGRYMDSVNFDTVKNSFRYFAGEFFDSREIGSYGGFFVLDNNELFLTNLAIECLKDRELFSSLVDVVEYGILRYQKEFGREDYGMPFLKLYQTYSMRDLGMLANYEMKHSSIRGQGVWKASNKVHCFFVNLHKDKDIKESIDYKDKFIDSKHFQWQSPNNTRIDSSLGREYAFNKNNGIALHLFVRKQEKSCNNTLPFVYVGKINSLSFEGEKPITIQYELENTIPDAIYRDLTLIVGDYDERD